MKTFLEHTKENQEEGIGDSLKMGAAKDGGAIKKQSLIHITEPTRQPEIT